MRSPAEAGLGGAMPIVPARTAACVRARWHDAAGRCGTKVLAEAGRGAAGRERETVGCVRCTQAVLRPAWRRAPFEQAPFDHAPVPARARGARPAAFVHRIRERKAVHS